MSALQKLSGFIEQAKILESQIDSLLMVKNNHPESSIVVDGLLAGKRYALGNTIAAIKLNAAKLDD